MFKTLFLWPRNQSKDNVNYCKLRSNGRDLFFSLLLQIIQVFLWLFCLFKKDITVLFYSAFYMIFWCPDTFSPGSLGIFTFFLRTFRNLDISPHWCSKKFRHLDIWPPGNISNLGQFASLNHTPLGTIRPLGRIVPLDYSPPGLLRVHLYCPAIAYEGKIRCKMPVWGQGQYRCVMYIYLQYCIL